MGEMIKALAGGNVAKAVGALFDGFMPQDVGNMQTTTYAPGGGMDPDEAFAVAVAGTKAISQAKAEVIKKVAQMPEKTPAERLRDALNGAEWRQVLWTDEQFGEIKVLQIDGNDGNTYYIYIHFDEEEHQTPYLRVDGAAEKWRCMTVSESQVIKEIAMTMPQQALHQKYLGDFPSEENAEAYIKFSKDKSGPVLGDIFYDTETATLKVFTGGGVWMSVEQPEGPVGQSNAEYISEDAVLTGSGLAGDLGTDDPDALFDVKEWQPYADKEKALKKHKHILVTKPPITVSLNGQPVTPLKDVPVASPETLDELSDAVERRRERNPDDLKRALQRRRHGKKPHRTDFVIAAQEQGIMRRDDDEPTTLEPSSPSRLAIDVEDDEPVDF
jgi:hypothetical protein